ncbi:MAG: hypothetical protein Q4A12_05130 [Eubacteriales bacterium]|nr:hypothetical protein [Eubacteriales bacterium]
MKMAINQNTPAVRLNVYKKYLAILNRKGKKSLVLIAVENSVPDIVQY